MNGIIEHKPDKISVVIPVRNEADHIVACLRSIEVQTMRPDEVLVVDGCSDDETRSLVEEFARESDLTIRLISNSNRTIPAAMNLGLEASCGAVIVRVDGHTTINEHYIELALDTLGANEVAGVGGRKRAVGASRFGRAVAIAYSAPELAGTATYHHAEAPAVCEHVAFGVYRRDVALELGGWDEDLLVNQDFEFDYRLGAAGHKLMFNPEMVVEWRCRESPRELFRQYRRYGAGKVVVWKKHPGSLKARQVIPTAALALPVLSAALVFRRRRAAALVLLAAHPSSLLMMSFRQSTRMNGGDSDPHVALVAVSHYIMHMAFGFGVLDAAAKLASGRSLTRRDRFVANPANPGSV